VGGGANLSQWEGNCPLPLLSNTAVLKLVSNMNFSLPPSSQKYLCFTILVINLLFINTVHTFFSLSSLVVRSHTIQYLCLCSTVILCKYYNIFISPFPISASEMTYIVSSGALNFTHSLTRLFRSLPQLRDYNYVSTSHPRRLTYHHREETARNSWSVLHKHLSLHQWRSH